jgi:hypothetical protein
MSTFIPHPLAAEHDERMITLFSVVNRSLEAFEKLTALNVQAIRCRRSLSDCRKCGEGERAGSAKRSRSRPSGLLQHFRNAASVEVTE